MFRDFLYALRSLRRSPGFVAVAVVCLGVGLGIATSVYAMLDAVIRPYVPYAHPERLFWLYGGGDGASGQVGRVDHIAAFRQASSLYESLIVVDVAGRQLPLSIDAQVVEGDVAVVGPEYFPFFGIRPARGRFFRPGDGGETAVITHDLWRGTLAGGPLDRARVTVDGRSYAIIGVLPRGAGDPVRSGVLLARRDGAADNCCLAAVRVRPGENWSSLMQGLVQVAASLERLHGTGRQRFFFAAASVRRDPFQFDEIHGALAAGGMAVLLIACANLANMMLARGLSRRRDLVVHVAIGATRAAVIRQMLWEAVLVSLAGGALGALATWWGGSLLRGSVPQQLRWAGVLQTEINWRVFAFGLIAALASALLFGLAPALRTSDVRAGEVLKDGAGTTTGRRGSWHGIVVAEVALTLVLLVGASLLIRTVANLRRLHADVATRGLLAGVVTVRDSVRYRFGRAADYAPQRELLDMARSVPGVVAVASSSREGSFGCNLLGDQGSGPPRHLWINAYTRVSQEYVRTRGLHVIAGRDFTEGDVGGAGAAIVDSITAAQLWPDGRAVGRMIKTCKAHVNTPWIPVVGVTRPSPVFNRMEPYEVAAAEVYVLQPDTAVRGLLVRVQGLESEASELLIRAVRTRYAGRLSWAQFRPWRQEYDDYLAARRFIGRLFGAFSLLALALAATGLYGAIAYGVSRRVREFAIRVALGADAPAIARLVVRDAAVVVLAGTAIGGAIGLWAGRFVDPWLYGVYFVDAPSLVVAELILLAAATAACWTPVRRAMRADPIQMLRAI